MSKKNDPVNERLKRLMADDQLKKENTRAVDSIVNQDAAKIDFSNIANQFEGIMEKQPTYKEGTTKLTLYLDNDIAAAFYALCTKRGDKRKYASQAIADFVTKKYHELKEKGRI